ncbi:MAG: SAM-dependent methyltransferase [Betaproteobacteria bacterium]
MTGTLYLVPNLLGVVAPIDVLPERTLAVARRLTHWVVETEKPARAFLKAVGVNAPIASLDIRPLGDARDAAALERLLAPAGVGADIGLLSDAGCPGVADPGAMLVAAAHTHGISVVPLVGPSSLLLALMASGMNGQQFAFHGYLPVPATERANALRRLEDESRQRRCTQLFIETPYRNTAMLTTIVATLRSETIVCVAADLTLPTQSIIRQPVAAWRRTELSTFDKRPAIFLLDA